MSGSSGGERARWTLAVAVSLLLSAPYLIAAQAFFYTDDWVHLSAGARVPPWAVWRYFSPRVIWFYRPLQALQFGWLYHAVGLHPLAYNLSLWVMHLGVCALVYTLASRLLSRPAALLSTALFASQWLCANALLWRSNFSALHSALVTLGLCLVFLRYLETRRPTLLAAAYALLVLGFMAKETAVSSPLLLACLWWHEGGDIDRAYRACRLREGARLIGPFALVALLYVAFHHYLVRDVYEGYVGPYYCLAPPAQAFEQTLSSCGRALLSFTGGPALFPRLGWPPAVQQTLEILEISLPIALGFLAWRRRDRLLALGLLWIFATLIPTAWLVTYRMDRFFYLSMVGVSLITAHSVEHCRQAAVDKPSWRPVLESALPVALAFLLFAQTTKVARLCLAARDDSHLLSSAFQTIRRSAGALPNGSLVIVRHGPEQYFGSGIGVNEMVRMALRDSAAIGIVQGQPVSPRWARRLDRAPAAYTLDLALDPPALRRVYSPRGQPPSGSPPAGRQGSASNGKAALRPSAAGASSTLYSSGSPAIMVR